LTDQDDCLFDLTVARSRSALKVVIERLQLHDNNYAKVITVLFNDDFLVN